MFSLLIIRFCQLKRILSSIGVFRSIIVILLFLLALVSINYYSHSTSAIKIDFISYVLLILYIHFNRNDKAFIYKVAKSRLDKVSQEFYDSPYFGWLILQANPQFGGIENNIYDGAILIIPFPLLPSLQDYKSALENHFYYYGR